MEGITVIVECGLQDAMSLSEFFPDNPDGVGSFRDVVPRSEWIFDGQHALGRRWVDLRRADGPGQCVKNVSAQVIFLDAGPAIFYPEPYQSQMDASSETKQNSDCGWEQMVILIE